jgi:predicted PurR-regulated permease PerM
MKPEYAVMEAAYNLLKAAEQNQSELRNLLQKLESSSSLLDTKTRTMDNTISNVIKGSVQDASAEIAKKITKDISNANEIANVAAERLDDASRKSFVIFSVLHLLFFVISVLVLWFFFMKDIPTREELIEMQNTADELEKYGDVYDCHGKKCVEISGDSGLVSPKTKKKLYYIKPSR